MQHDTVTASLHIFMCHPVCRLCLTAQKLLHATCNVLLYEAKQNKTGYQLSNS